MTRALTLCLAAATAAPAFADRLISAPTARKLPYRTARVEYLGAFDRARSQSFYLGVGVGPSWELELRSEAWYQFNIADTFDLGYNVISAIPGLSPGIALGVQDALNRTRDGVRSYLALTQREPFFTIDGEFPADITIGTFLSPRLEPYVALSIPFSKGFHLLAEHNARRLSAGFEVQPVRDLSLRMITRDRDLLGSVQWSWRF